MQKGISFVGLMDLGSLDALKKASAAKIKQTSAALPDHNVEITERESKNTSKLALASSEQVITYPQPC